jgi:bifunctional DNA-binding transcriptional regulator/antitoxin component of YhaV-PrlF toxin-antitoxin module
MYNYDNLEIRKVQALTGERSFTVVFPKQFAVELGIGKGDFLKCRVEGRRLIIEKLVTGRETQ